MTKRQLRKWAWKIAREASRSDYGTFTRYKRTVRRQQKRRVR